MGEKSIPVSVFTGYLGAGKTTTIINLIKKFPPSYKVVLLKNEFGDLNVDGELAKNSSIGVAEMMNGCLCCVLVGQMQNALFELKEKYNPDRILVEASGSAFPAPIAWQIRQLASSGFHLDSIVTLIDCVNFKGYEDTSYTAKMQAKYTDVILLNKHELATEDQIDRVLDSVYELNPDTPVLRCQGTEGVDPDLIFGIDTKLFSALNKEHPAEKERVGFEDHHAREVDLLELSSDSPLAKTKLEVEQFFTSLPSDNFYRIKGMIHFGEGFELANFAFGRPEWTPLPGYHSDSCLRLTMMGVDLKGFREKVSSFFQLGEGNVKFHEAHRH